MAQTKRKRRSKHRGNAAGTIEARGRTGPQADRRASSASARRRAARGPALHRADVDRRRHARRPRVGDAVRAVHLRHRRLGADGRPPRSRLSVAAFLIYVPLGYKVDRMFWERRMRKAGRPLAARRPSASADGRPHASPSGRCRRTATSRGPTAAPGDRDRPGRRGAAAARGDRGARRRGRGDPAHAHALRPRRRGRAARARDRRGGLVPRARGPGARRHHALRPVAGLRPVRVLRRRPHGRRRRAARARRARDRRAVHARALAGPRDVLDRRPSRRSSPATCCSRARSAAPTCPAATTRR